MLSILLYAEGSQDFRRDFTQIVVFADLERYRLTAGLLRDVDGHMWLAISSGTTHWHVTGLNGFLSDFPINLFLYLVDLFMSRFIAKSIKDARLSN